MLWPKTPCAVSTCREVLRRPRGFCRAHWAQVPRAMKLRLWSLAEDRAYIDRHETWVETLLEAAAAVGKTPATAPVK